MLPCEQAYSFKTQCHIRAERINKYFEVNKSLFLWAPVVFVRSHSFSSTFGFRLKVFKLLLHGAPLFVINELIWEYPVTVLCLDPQLFSCLCMFLLTTQAHRVLCSLCALLYFLHRRIFPSESLQQFIVEYPLTGFCGRGISMQTLGGWQCIHLVLDANVLLIKPFASCSSHYYDPQNTHLSRFETLKFSSRDTVFNTLI